MEGNAFKISILAWLAFLLFIFSCESKEEKERARVEKRDLAKVEKKSREGSMRKKYDLRTNEDFQAGVDSILRRVTDSFETACKKDSACRKKQYEAIERGLEGCKKDSICFKEAYENRCGQGILS